MSSKSGMPGKTGVTKRPAGVRGPRDSGKVKEREKRLEDERKKKRERVKEEDRMSRRKGGGGTPPSLPAEPEGFAT